MERDNRYQAIKALIETGKITQFKEIFTTHEFPITTLAKAMGTNFMRLRKYINKPGLFNLLEIEQMADYYRVDDELMYRIIKNQMSQDKRTRKK